MAKRDPDWRGILGAGIVIVLIGCFFLWEGRRGLLYHIPILCKRAVLDESLASDCSGQRLFPDRGIRRNNRLSSAVKHVCLTAVVEALDLKRLFI